MQKWKRQEQGGIYLRYPSGTSLQHKRAATQDLYESIRSNSVLIDKFDPLQIEAIMNKADRIPDYIWHHHQDTGRMQLIPKQIHIETAHVGGDSIWPKIKK